MDAFSYYLKSIIPSTPLSKEEERALIKKGKNGDNAAREQVIISNLKFVVSVAKKYQNQGLTIDELVSEGNLGLVKAFEKFDVSKDVKFITYAVWWIRQAIFNSLHENAKTIRLPLNKISNITKATKASESLENTLGRYPSMNELEEYLEGDTTAIRDLKFNYTVIGLDTPHTENNETLNEVIPADLSYCVLKTDEEFKKELTHVLKTFPKREKSILKMYYGIEQVRPYTLKEIGVDMGLTRERIRQIKEKILKKLRSKKHSKTLEDFLKWDT